MKRSKEIENLTVTDCIEKNTGLLCSPKIVRSISGVKTLVSVLLVLLSIESKAQNGALVLNGAFVMLSGGTQTQNICMVVNQTNTTGIVRTGGHISSEGQYNLVKWNSGSTAGNYVIPFGVGGVAADYIPFQFNKTSATNADITASTYSTTNLNSPFPNPVTSMTQAINSIDRFWDVRSSAAVTADVSFSYRGIENSNTFCLTDTIKAQYWNNSNGPWSALAGPGNPAVTSGIGSVGPIPNQTYFQNTETIWALTNQPLNVDAGTSASLTCSGSSFTLNGTSNNAGVTYSWTGPGIVSGANTSSPIINTPGNYTLTVTDPITGCAAQSTVNIATGVAVNAGFNASSTSGYSPLSVDFTNTSVGASTFNWSFGNGSVDTSTNTSTVYSGSGTYTVQLIASEGPCSDTAYTTIVVNDGLTIEIPNVFTPNNDGTNDLFTITSTGVKEITLQIFNRWGQKMYEFTGAKAGWDGVTDSGQKATDGTYFYFIIAKGYDDKEVKKNGSLGLYR
jgi:gliding motility-associated-like protein